jgi:acetyl esterase/lipase
MPSDETEFERPRPRKRERLTAAVLRAALRTMVKPALSPKVPIVWQRWWLAQLARLMRASGQATFEAGTAGGVKGEWQRPRRSGDAAASIPAPGAILYLDGGGYCLGSPQTHRALTSRLARAAGLPVFVADYRLAPEHPFPSALDDAVAACRSLVQEGPVVIAGDSAGGGLALATALYLRQREIGSATALVVFSPWADLTLSAITDAAARKEVMLSAAWLGECARHYLAGESAATPLASPVFADLRGLPPTFIQAAADELLCGDALRLRDALVAAGVTVQCEILPEQWHTFQLCAGILPAANTAIERAARFISLALAR